MNESDAYKEALVNYKLMASKVKELILTIASVSEVSVLRILLKQLAISIYDFDVQVKFMIKEFPEFSSSKKDSDRLISENYFLLKTTLEEYKKISNSEPN